MNMIISKFFKSAPRHKRLVIERSTQNINLAIISNSIAEISDSEVTTITETVSSGLGKLHEVIEMEIVNSLTPKVSTAKVDGRGTNWTVTLE